MALVCHAAEVLPSICILLFIAALTTLLPVAPPGWYISSGVGKMCPKGTYTTGGLAGARCQNQAAAAAATICSRWPVQDAAAVAIRVFWVVDMQQAR